MLLLALAITGGASLLIMVCPQGLVTLGMWLILPGLLMLVAVNLFIYLIAFSVGWFPFAYLLGPRAALASGLVAVALAAIGLPMELNRVTDSYVSQAADRDHDPTEKIGPIKSVGLRLADQTWSEGMCDDLCQALLYNNSVQRVEILPTPYDATRNRPVAFGYSIERQPSCPAAVGYLGQGQPWLGGGGTRANSANAVRQRIANGECLVREPAGAADTEKPELVIHLEEEPLGGDPFWGGGQINALELVRDGRVVARGSAIRPNLWSAPLLLEPSLGPNSDTNYKSSLSGWHWHQSFNPPPTLDVAGLLHRFTTLNSDVPQGADPVALCRSLDAALDNPSIPKTSAVFALVEDYFKQFSGIHHPGADDVKRFARIIADDRVTEFTNLPLYAIQEPAELLSLRDPLLNRIYRVVQTDPGTAFVLARRVSELPAGAFRDPDPRLDEFLSDPAHRRLASGLVNRLADRGPTEANGLYTFMVEGWTTPQWNGHDQIGEYGGDSKAAIRGLCRIGQQSPQMLPKLRQAAADRIVPDHVQQWDEWRATLIAMGASPIEFELPSNRNERLDFYRQSLLNEARQGCK